MPWQQITISTIQSLHRGLHSSTSRRSIIMLCPHSGLEAGGQPSSQPSIASHMKLSKAVT
jgi:hypothetical protein